MSETLQRRLRELPAERRELLEAMLRRRGVEIERALIPRRPDPAAEAPLSFAQERLWFLDRLTSGDAAYNLPLAEHLGGEVRPPALAAALSRVVARHEVLRTRYPLRGESAAQAIEPPAPVPLPVIDLAALPGGAERTETRRLAAGEARRLFDLERGPVLRAALVRGGGPGALLLLTVHHVAADGLSLSVLRRELETGYRAALDGRAARLPELPVQYADFAAWQRRRLAGGALSEALDRWRRRLDGALPLELPADRPRSALRSRRGARVRRRLASVDGGALRALAARAQATPFMVALAAFHALLARLAGQLDVSVGTPVAGRDREEIEPLIGLFVNTLVLRVDCAGEPGFAELVRRVRRVAIEALESQEVPFDRLVEELAPERDLARPPLFQVMFTFRESGGAAAGAPLDLPDNGTAKFDLTLSATLRGGRLEASLEHARELFDRSTAERWLGAWEVLLGAALADPERPLSALPLLTPAQSAQVLREWSGRPGPAAELEAAPVPLAARVAAMAAAEPGRPAVAWQGGELSYGELWRRSDRLAARLRRLGLAAEEPVLLLTDRRPEALIGVFGVLAAGGAYAPVAAAQPRERLARVVRESRARLALVAEEDRELARGLGLEALVPEEAGGPGAPPVPAAVPVLETPDALAAPAEVAPDALAYVIFTSGSTGRPKGVMVSHRSMAVFADSLEEAVYRPGAAPGAGAAGDGLRVSLNAPLAFDASVQQLVQLARGRCVVLIPEEVRPDGGELLELLRRERVDLLDCTPSHLGLLLAAGLAESPGGPRRVLVGGEAIGGELWRRLAADPHRRYFNVYGPTECTVDATAAAVEGVRPVLGHPLPGVRAYVIERGGAPAAPGVAGELRLGGFGLARGYLGRPAATAERFVPDPFADSPGARLYRTGDRVRRLADGRLEYLGRIDLQVKLRGHRIELGEIEAALAEHPRVRAAAAALRPRPGDGSGGSDDRSGGELDQVLVAYAVWRGPDGAAGAPPAATAGELRGFLAGRLPAAMVPSAVVLLDALPLTGSGKVDRARLPAPGSPADGGAGEAEPPRTPVEQAVAGIFRELLGVPAAGRGDGFFALGGHSLMATRLVSRVRSTLGVELPLRAVFEAPSVAGLAARVEVGLRAGEAAAPPIERVPRDGSASRGGALPLSFGQQRLWFLHRLEPESAAYNTLLAVELEGPLDAAALAAALSGVVRRHEVLRTRYVEDSEGPVQVIDAAAPAPLPRVDLAALGGAAGAALRRLARREAARPFDLAAGPVLRALLVRLGAERHALLAGLHHIASDGWSVGVLAREIAALYRAEVAGPLGAEGGGADAGLPALPVQYADFAAWQRRWLSGETLERQLAYWRDRLAGAAALELPADRPRPPVPRHRGGRVPVALPPAVAGGLRRLAAERGATLFMALLAGFTALLARYAGRDDVTVGTPVAGRVRSELEPLIGFFVNTLALRLRPEREVSFAERVELAREAALGAYAHQELPFERLVEALDPERDPSRHPVFQVLLTLQNVPREELRLPGLRARPLGGDAGVAKLDLALTLVEAGDRLAGSLDYDADLFDRATVERMATDLEVLLAGAAAEPGRTAAEPPLLGPARGAQALHARTDRPGAAPPGAGQGGGLPAPGVPRAAAGLGEAEPPRLPVEQAVAEIYRGLLGVAEVGRDDGFFALGGHSLLATRLVSRLRATFGVEVPVRAVFEAPTVAGMAARVEAGLRAGGEAAPPIERTPRDRPLPLSFGQQGLWFLHRMEPESPAYNTPLGVELVGRLDEAALAAALTGVVRRHEVLRTRYPDYEGDPVQAIDPPAAVRLPRIDLGALGAAALAVFGRLARREAVRPFDLAAGPILRPLLIRLGAERHALLVGLHHIASDGWSVGLLMREVTVLYRAALARAAGADAGPGLPELAIQYADYAAWQRRWLAGAGLERQVGYWRERLAGAPGAIELPLDRARPPVQGHRGGRVQVELPAPVVQALRRLAGERGATLFIALLAGFSGLLARWSGNGDVTVGTAVAGRTRAELEPLIGFFVNTLALRVHAAGDAPFATRLELAREAALGAYAHQELPFERLVEVLDPERDPSRHPIFQATLALQNLPREELRLPGLSARPLPGGTPATKLDLELTLVEVGDRLAGGLAFDADLFDRATAERMAAELGALLAAAAAAPEAPLSSLPGLGDGERRQLAARAPAHPAAARPEPGPPRTPAERLLAELFQDLLGTPAVDRGDSFFALGGHSLLVVRLLAAVKRRTGRRLGVTAVFRDPTPAGLAAELEDDSSGGLPGDGAAGTPPRALIELRPGGRRPPLVLVHPGGGEVLPYAEIAQRLGAGRPVLAFRARGLTAGTPPDLAVDAMAEVYLHELATQRPGEPRLLAGWSFGGLVAYEMARRLSERGEPAPLLVLIDAPAPAAGRRPPGEYQTLVSFCRDLGARLSPEEIARLRRDLEGAVAPGTLPSPAAVLAAADALGLFPAGIGGDELGRRFEVFRACSAAADRYPPRRYAGRVVAIAAAASGAATGEAWRALVDGPLTVRSLPGDHHSLLRPPEVAALVDLLTTSIEDTAPDD